MTIEYTPVGIACNLSCTYCYQDPMRDAGNINSPRNWDRSRKVLENLGRSFIVFGGEPLLTPIEHLEEVWKFGLEKFGENGIQTNGSLITDRHIDLFSKYNVGVGISIDGSGDLNSPRVCSRDTLEATNRTLDSIKKLCARKRPPSLIVTIHKANASRNKLDQFLAWLDELESWGIRYLNLHNLEIEKGMGDVALNEEDTIWAFLTIYEWSKTSKMRVEPFVDIRALLLEDNPQVSCVWNHCDPATTAAVQGVEPDGTMVNCGRTNKDGVNWVKGDETGYERYLLLRQTPQEVGGCKDCTFFIFCKGQCPGTAIDGDWRNRTRDCKLWYTLFQTIEFDIIGEGKIPISRNIPIKSSLENQLVQTWMGHSDSPHGDIPHGDHHGDAPHGDAHLDSNLNLENAIPGVLLDQPPEFFTS
jgi:uncharacterized protein